MKQRAVSIKEKDPGNNEQGIVTGRKTADKMGTQKKENQPKKKKKKRQRMKKNKRGKKSKEIKLTMEVSRQHKKSN